MSTYIEQYSSINLNPVLSVTKDGTFLYSNETSEPILNEWGVRVGEKLPSSIVDLVQKVISRNSPEKIKVNVGKKVFLIVFDPSPKQECVNISGFDISNQRELDEKPHESEEKYHKIYNLIEEGIAICELVLDEKGQPIDVIILEANPAYEKHSGLRREQVIGRPLKEVLSTLEHIWLDRCGEVILTDTGTHFEEYNTSLEKWFEVSASPIGGNKFVAVFRNITERKKIEEALHESEEKFRTLFNSIDEGFCLVEVIFDAAGKPVELLMIDYN
jgi:PAS domain S-box-containing protein